jgi:hypothetical protein
VLLNAIAHSDGTRASVTRNLLKTHIHGGYTGDMVDHAGDPGTAPVIFRIQVDAT